MRREASFADRMKGRSVVARVVAGAIAGFAAARGLEDQKDDKHAQHDDDADQDVADDIVLRVGGDVAGRGGNVGAVVRLGRRSDFQRSVSAGGDAVQRQRGLIGGRDGDVEIAFERSGQRADADFEFGMAIDVGRLVVIRQTVKVEDFAVRGRGRDRIVVVRDGRVRGVYRHGAVAERDARNRLGICRIGDLVGSDGGFAHRRKIGRLDEIHVAVVRNLAERIAAGSVFLARRREVIRIRNAEYGTRRVGLVGVGAARRVDGQIAGGDQIGRRGRSVVREYGARNGEDRRHRRDTQE